MIPETRGIMRQLIFKLPNYFNMKSAKTKDTAKLVFSKKNYILMIIGIVFLFTGYIAMALSNSKIAIWIGFEEAEFGFNTLTLTIAPILIVIGFIIEFFAIMYKEKKQMPESPPKASL